MMARIAVCGLLMLAATVSTDAGQQVAIRVSPSVSFAPANLNIQATVEADAGNRAVEIVADSQDFYRSSEIPLDGLRGPRTAFVQFLSLPTGDYDVSARLLGTDGQVRANVQELVRVVAGGDER